MRSLVQSDNTGTWGWRNIWGLFTFEELHQIKTQFPSTRMSATWLHTPDVNTMQGLSNRINRRLFEERPVPSDYSYYIDYPKEIHDDLWSLLYTFTQEDR